MSSIFNQACQFMPQRLYKVELINQTMQDLQLKFQGSPQKFGKAVYCDLIYTQSKLYDHVLYKDLINFKDISNFKSQAIALGALNQLLQDKYANLRSQKNTIIQTQQQEIKFLREKNQLMTNKNIERTNKIIKDHQDHVRNLLIQRENDVLFIQGEKQILELKIEQLQLESSKNRAIVISIKDERLQLSKKQQQFKQLSTSFQSKIQNLEKNIQLLERDHKSEIKNLNDEKLEIELHFKKLMVERSQDFKFQLEELEKFYLKKLQLQDEQKLNVSLAAKETLNRTMKNYQSQLDQAKRKSSQIQLLVEKLQNQLKLEKAKTSILENDVKKQDDILDKYQGYLKQSDQNIISLKELLLECQEQLERAKVCLEKNKIQKDSFQNRIKICEEEAKMWRESYYLNKSRAFNDN